ncbi:hypothetical protein LTR36_001926 [Oleoguttula mirabilis]|uniref:Uncharacterized protein n=1 Tax=Oleoguttula mirabilis TaxID=1507867 RepID=A0AAV9JMF1_9PEZI|nr:hypothetical protein LTR36_001926 [Oleoguttula mirabilis]
MASHIVCEAVRKGLEAQIAALAAGYGNEVDRLQTKIGALTNDEAAATNKDLKLQLRTLKVQHTTEMAQAKVKLDEDMAKFKASEEEGSRVSTEKLVLEHAAELEDVRKEQQAKHQQDLEDHQHEAATLQAQIVSLQHAQEDTKCDEVWYNRKDRPIGRNQCRKLHAKLEWE